MAVIRKELTAVTLTLVASGVMAGLFTQAAELSPKERFAESVSAAKANLATPAGQKYDGLLSKHFEENYGSVMSECFETTKQPNATAFEMVFVLSKEGKVRDLLIWPETNISLCFKKKLSSASLPVPPAEPYLAYMEMRFAP